MNKSDIKALAVNELKHFLCQEGFPAFSAQQVFSWVYKKRVEDFSLMTDLSKEARDFLKRTFYFSRLTVGGKDTSFDGTEKFLFRLCDGHLIESVLIPEGERLTVCLSTQVGCKFRCRFCFSGQEGFIRNLSVAEILNQYFYVQDECSPTRISNIVLMGIGEPLDNFDNTIKAVRMLREPGGLSLGKSRICISTCGLIPQIKALAKENLGVKLSVSLHSPFSDIRSLLMPINKKYPLAELIRTLKLYWGKGQFPLTFEYVLISGLTVREEDAHKLSRLLEGLKYKLNLIPLNGAGGRYQPATPQEISIFGKALRKQGIFFTVRASRGPDIHAACGQLRVHLQEKERVVKKK